GGRARRTLALPRAVGRRLGPPHGGRGRRIRTLSPRTTSGPPDGSVRLNPSDTKGDGMTEQRSGPQIGLIMGSDSDWPTMEAAAEAVAEFGIPFEVGVVSAHRTPQKMLDYAREAAG